MCLQKSHERGAKKNCHERGAKKNVEHSRQECLEKARTVMKGVSGKSRKVIEDVSGKIWTSNEKCSYLCRWKFIALVAKDIQFQEKHLLWTSSVLSCRFHHKLLMCIFSVSWKSIKGLMCSILSPAQTLREDAK